MTMTQLLCGNYWTVNWILLDIIIIISVMKTDLNETMPTQ